MREQKSCLFQKAVLEQKLSIAKNFFETPHKITLSQKPKLNEIIIVDLLRHTKIF